MAKPVVKQTVPLTKAALTTSVNTKARSAIAPIAEPVKTIKAKTEEPREKFNALLAASKTSIMSPTINAWANFAQGEYDTLAGQADGFLQFYDDPVQTTGSTAKYIR